MAITGARKLRGLRQACFQLERAGKVHGYAYPWHKTKDPFKLLVAEFFLRRTTRKVVARVFPRVLNRYPTASLLARAHEGELLRLTYETGLRRRSRQLIELARAVLKNGGLRPDRKLLQSLPSIGSYIADAVLLYGYGVKSFPLDRNVQRVLTRVVNGNEPKGKVDAYNDGELFTAVHLLTGKVNAATTRDIHQGALYVAWTYCRSRPRCAPCPLVRACRYVKNLVALSRS